MGPSPNQDEKPANYFGRSSTAALHDGKQEIDSTRGLKFFARQVLQKIAQMKFGLIQTKFITIYKIKASNVWLGSPF